MTDIIILLFVFAFVIAALAVIMFKQNQKIERANADKHQALVAQRQQYETKHKQALKAQRSITKGQITEHMLPVMKEFRDKHNLNDARFVGKPIDYIVFDGLADGTDVTVTFVECKTGKSQLNANERSVRDAIDNKRVKWEIIRIDG